MTRADEQLGVLLRFDHLEDGVPAEHEALLDGNDAESLVLLRDNAIPLLSVRSGLVALLSSAHPVGLEQAGTQGT